MIIQKVDTLVMPLRVPGSLRTKSVNTSINQEIYFIDSLNDLFFCVHQTKSYHLLRVAGILRVLLEQSAIKKFADRYNYQLTFKATEHKLTGTILSKKESTSIHETLKEVKRGSNSYRNLDLGRAPLKNYNLEEFCNKGCLSIIADKEYVFSVQSVIRLLANKHGVSHFEFKDEFESSDQLSFLLDDFNPFSLGPNSRYLQKIKEISMIFFKAVYPLAEQIIQNLQQYDGSFSQGRASFIAKAISVDELEKGSNPNES